VLLKHSVVSICWIFSFEDVHTTRVKYFKMAAIAMLNTVSRLVGKNVGRPSTIFSSCVRQFRASGKLLAEEAEVTGQSDLRLWIKPNDFQKFVLIVGKAYKKKVDIPDRVSPQTMKKAFDIFRGRTLMVMLALSFFGSYVMIRSGRNLQASGDSLAKRGAAQELMWREQGRQEREDANGQK
jgi:hypothetical protein